MSEIFLKQTEILTRLESTDSELMNNNHNQYRERPLVLWTITSFALEVNFVGRQPLGTTPDCGLVESKRFREVSPVSCAVKNTL